MGPGEQSNATEITTQRRSPITLGLGRLLLSRTFLSHSFRNKAGGIRCRSLVSPEVSFLPFSPLRPAPTLAYSLLPAHSSSPLLRVLTVYQLLSSLDHTDLMWLLPQIPPPRTPRSACGSTQGPWRKSLAGSFSRTLCPTSPLDRPPQPSVSSSMLKGHWSLTNLSPFLTIPAHHCWPQS